jgi:hypothetical protein
MVSLSRIVAVPLLSRRTRVCKGDDMTIEYYVIGAIALLILVGLVTLLPDLIRYVRISTM